MDLVDVIILLSLLRVHGKNANSRDISKTQLYNNLWKSCLVTENGSCYEKPLLICNRKDVRIIDASGFNKVQKIIASGLEDAAALDFLFEDKSIYYSDVSHEVIRKIWSFNETKLTIDIATRVTAEGIACDWLNKNIYWTDSGTQRIEVANNKGEFRKTLLTDGIDQPRAIVLDVRNGFMYWTDVGEIAKIERVGMDGDASTRSVLISKNIFWPNGLALDLDQFKLFWADAKMGNVNSCDLDGSNRRKVISSGLQHPFALDLLNNTLYWTDWRTRSIHSCDKFTGGNQKVVLSDIYAPMGLKSFEPKRQRQVEGSFTCSNTNRGCSHLCLASPTYPFYQCACSNGIKLLSDNKTCNRGFEEMLVVARRTDLRVISLDTSIKVDTVINAGDIKHAIAIDYDPVEDFVYWTDDADKGVWRVHLNGTDKSKVIDQVKHPDGLAIDGVARNLYWTDTGTDRIEVSRLDGSSRTTIISTNLEEPRAIALDPISGFMFWTDWGSKPKIERSFLDGTGRLIIANTSLGWPNGIAVDHKEQKVYWADAKTDKIEKANIDGTWRRVLVDLGSNHIFGLSLLGNYLYYTDWQKRVVARVNKHSGKDTSNIALFSDLMGIKAIRMMHQQGTNTCAKNNGGCSHLCLMTAVPDKPKCECPVGMIGPICKPSIFLISSESDSMKMTAVESQTHNFTIVPIPKFIGGAIAIDVDITEDYIYWIDKSAKSINRASMKSGDTEIVVQHGLYNVSDFSFDWMSKNVYWLDVGIKQIEVAKSDGSYRKLLIWKTLQNPTSIMVDPLNGFLYWTDVIDETVIIRAQLDGTNRERILQKYIITSPLVIDFTEQRLYWISKENESYIETVSINGSDYSLINTSLSLRPQNIKGLAAYNKCLYLADPTEHVIRRINTSDGTSTILRTTLEDFVTDLFVYDINKQKETSNCTVNNGGCEQLCFTDRASDEYKKIRCTCSTHFTLRDDERTCSGPEDFFLLANGEFIIRINNFNDNTTSHIVKANNIDRIDYDPIDKNIYWIENTNRNQKSIRMSSINGSNVRSIVQSSYNKPYDIAVNPHSRILYWSCARRNAINITRLNGIYIGAIIEGDGVKPRSIALNIHSGHIFFVNEQRIPRIERADLDGTNHIVLIEKELAKPGPLTIDVTGEKLFWVEQKLQRIESSRIDGRDHKIFIHSVDPAGILVFDNFLYWTDRRSNMIIKVDKKTAVKKAVIAVNNRGLTDIKEVTNKRTEWQGNPCSRNNGGCSDICIPNNMNKGVNFRCGCTKYMRLKYDDVSCDIVPSCTDDQFPCISGDLHCIPKLWRCDGSVECEDNSDELGCSRCLTDEFDCGNLCIKISSVCDGIPNCFDASDEINCSTSSPDFTEIFTNNSVVSTENNSDGENQGTNIALYGIAGVIILLFIILFVCSRYYNKQKGPKQKNERSDHADVTETFQLNTTATGESSLLEEETELTRFGSLRSDKYELIPSGS